jgi:hypothetical protein
LKPRNESAADINYNVMSNLVQAVYLASYKLYSDVRTIMNL